MVWIEVRSPTGEILKVVTGARIGPERAAERLRIPDNLRIGQLDPVDMPATWAAWVAANPQHPRAQLLNPSPTDPQQRQYIYNRNQQGFRLVSGTPNAGEAANICAARELHEETGLDVRGTLDRLLPLPNVGVIPAFRVDATAAECAAITALLTQRIQTRMGEIFDFRWDPPAAPAAAPPRGFYNPNITGKPSWRDKPAAADPAPAMSFAEQLRNRKKGGRKTRRTKRSRRTRRR
jgi:8-oxo-dGTP pyrophosphatase MutT (NUDIX family)